jgi:hypothetical protein
MKRCIPLLLTLLCALAACTPTPAKEDPTKLPQKRPADFEISFHESGSTDDPVADYMVASEQAAYKKTEGKHESAWIFHPDPDALDALYAIVLENNAIDITAAEEKGSNPQRFGYKLEIKYNGISTSVRDQGTTYIQKEDDYNRFMDVIAAVREFVGTGIADQMIPVNVQLVLDARSPKPEALSVDLAAANLIEYADNMAPGDTLTGETKPLKGSYLLQATARLGGKDWTWSKNIDLYMGPSKTTLLLGKNGFEEAH